MQLLHTLRRVASQSLLFALLIPTITNQVAAQTQPTDHFRSRASGNWGAFITWESSNDNTNWIPADTIPTSACASITIMPGHTVNLAGSHSGRYITVSANATLKLDPSDNLSIANEEGDDLTVFGVLDLQRFLATVSDIRMKPGSEYIRKITTTDGKINSCIWEDSSTTRIIAKNSITGGPWELTNQNQSYYNFIFDGSLLIEDYSLQLNDLFEVRNKAIIVSTNSKNLIFTNSNIDLILNIGNLELQNNSNCILSSGSGNIILNINGNLNIGSVAGIISRFGIGNTSMVNNYLNIFGDINVKSGSYITNGNINFTCTDSIQIINKQGIITKVNYLIKSGVKLTSLSMTVSSGYTLIIENDGSLYTNSSVLGTMQRTLSNADWTIPLDGWHLLSSPVAAQALNTGGFLEADYDFYKWSEPQNLWLNQKVSSNNITSFTPGEGYFVAYDNGGTKTFTGTFNTASLPFVNLSKTTDSPYSGFHLLGNPFPCALDWGSGSWNRTNFSDVAMVWNEAAMNYIPLTADAGNIIPACQGFFVQALSATNSIIVPADARTHGSAPFNKKTAAAGLLHLKVTSGGNQSWDEAIIMCDPTALKEFDRMDGHEMQGSENAPHLWTATGDEMLCVNSLPADDVPPVIPLYFRPGSDGNYLLEVADITMPAPVYLEDLVTGKVILLENSVALPFTAAGGDAPERFRLHTGPVGLPQDKSVAPLTVYSSGNTVTISNPTGTHLKGEVAFSDLLGKVVKRSTINSRSPVTIPACDLATGVYLVAVKLTDRSEVFKVYIRN